MRLWSLHPKYLDARGLVALWRESLLAQAVLRNETRGYRNHPQLDRFRQQSSPPSAISLYLRGIHIESLARGYSFDRDKIQPTDATLSLDVTSGQIEYEWEHLMVKLETRSPKDFENLRGVHSPEVHPLFTVCPGPVEPWERQ